MSEHLIQVAAVEFVNDYLPKYINTGVYVSVQVYG